MNTAPPQTARGFWSIERFVAFVLGPAVVAGSGWFSLLLAKQWGIHISGPEITGIFATGALGAGGLAYKWLHGRQLESSLEHNVVIAGITASPMAEGFIKTTAHDLEGLAQSAASKVVAGITGTHATTTGDSSPPEAPIPAAANDPAPSGQVADAGAAQGQ